MPGSWRGRRRLRLRRLVLLVLLVLPILLLLLTLLLLLPSLVPVLGLALRWPVPATTSSSLPTERPLAQPCVGWPRPHSPR
jgi:hypothetical protein